MKTKIQTVKYVELQSFLTPQGYEFFCERQKNLDIGNADFNLFSPIDVANEIRRIEGWNKGLGYNGDDRGVRNSIAQYIMGVGEDTFIKV